MSLSGPYDHDNVFARILRSETQAAKVYEDDEVLAFLDVFPQAHGHTLVVPKTPTRTLLDIEPAVLQTLIVRVQTVSRAVREALQPDGLAIMQFNGAAGGQTVYHLHFHIIPRWEGQTLQRHGGGMADPAELARLAEQIASKLLPNPSSSG